MMLQQRTVHGYDTEPYIGNSYQRYEVEFNVFIVGIFYLQIYEIIIPIFVVHVVILVVCFTIYSCDNIFLIIFHLVF